MPDAVIVLQKVVQAFDALGIVYLVGGSMASAVYGEFRATQDVDLVAGVREEHVVSLVAALSAEFYVDADLIRQAIEQESSFNLIHLATMFKADVFIRKRGAWTDEEFARRRRIEYPSDEVSASVYVASPEDTVLQKLLWYHLGGGVSDRQWNDVQGVLKVQAGALDENYLRHWAAYLNLTDLLNDALMDAGRGGAGNEPR